APARRFWLHEARALLVLAGLVAGFFWRPLFTADVWLPIGGGDLASFFYPLYSFIYRSIAAGQFPLWNPYSFAGMPLAADVQSGLFYPPNLVAWYTLPSYGYGTLEWLLILHYAWAVLGMYLWLRDGRLLRPAALAGAAAFAFCGFMTAHFGHLPMIFAAAWLPWNLLLARRAACAPNPAWVALAGIALALTFLAGHPQTLLYEGLAIGLYWLFLAWSGATTPAARPGARWPLAALPPAWQPVAWRLPLVALLAAGLGAVQFLPAQELADQSLRATLTYEQATEFAMQPVGLLNLVLPRVYGANPANYWVPWQSTENWGYLGIVALLLAGLGLLLRRDRRLGFLVALGGLAVLVMLGPFSIVFSWLHGLVPGFDRFRAAGRMLLLLGLANAGLAAFGLDTLLRLLPGARGPAGDAPAFGAALETDTVPGPAQQRRVQRLALGLGALAAFAALVVLPLSTAIFLAGFSIERGQIVLNDLYTAVLWLGLAAGLLAAAVRGRLAGRPAALALAGLLVLDLFSPNSHFNPTSDPILRAYDQPQAIPFLQAHTGPPAYYRLDSDTDVSRVWQPLIGTLAAIPDAGGLYNPLQLQRYTAYWEAAKAHRNSVLYDLLSVKYTLALSRTIIADPKFTHVANGANGVQVAENAHADPRLFLVHDAAIEPDDSTAVGKLLNGTVLGWHTIFLAGDPADRARHSPTPSTLEAGNPGETAAIVEYTPNRVVAQVDAREAGWAVLTDVWYPGWEATVDGQPVPIGRADSIFRAVPVLPGRHTLVFRFTPPPLLAGALISGTTLLLTLLGLAGVWGWRRRAAQRGVAAGSAPPHEPKP
ncbi:MAG TPA: YfhO family protein, partial [Chloroflexia bacterium]|nr:YfhO family protein [Chloroflexia bacterium]